MAVWISFRPKKNQQHLVLALEDTWTELLPVQIFEKRCPSNKRQAFFFKLWDSFIKDQFISSFSPHSLFWVLQYQPPHHHEKQPLSLSLPILMLLFSSRIHLQKIIPQFISRYKTDPNLPKNILIFFFIICLYEKKKKQETNEKSITEDLSNLEHFVFLEESKKCVFQNQSCPKSYEALRCCLPV